jgi:alpha-tubulin suppressor-like RCC1 family protein
MELVSIGNGSISSHYEPTAGSISHQICVSEDGIVICGDHSCVTKIWCPRTGNISLTPFRPNHQKIKLIAANMYFTVFTMVNNEIWTYGMNRIHPSSPSQDHEPLLELVSKEKEVIWQQLVCGYSHVLLIDHQNHAYSFGRGDCGQLGLGSCVSWIDSPQRIEFTNSSCSLVDSVSAGSSHSAFVLKNGSLYVCGSSNSHRLGLRTQSEMNPMTLAHHPSPCLVEDLVEIGFSFEYFDTSGVKLSSCGVWHTVAVLKETNDVYAWGWAKFGQFGRYWLPHNSNLITHHQ